MYFRGRESKYLFVHWSEITPGAAPLSLWHEQWWHQSSAEHASLCPAESCDNRAEEWRRSKVCSARCERSCVCSDMSIRYSNRGPVGKHRTMMWPWNRVLSVPSHQYRSDAHSNTGTDIIDIWINPPTPVFRCDLVKSLSVFWPTP